MVEKDELSLGEAARALGCSHTTVRRMVASGVLVVAREEWHGRQRRITVTAASVAAILDQRRQRQRETE